MANDLSRNPWLIDTASATTLHQNTTFVSSFVWSEYSNEADLCIIQDVGGRDLYRLKGTADLNPVQIVFPENGGRFRGLAITTLSAGVLAVNLR